MHIKRMHKIIETLTETALCELEKGVECVNTKEFGEVVDMIKDLAEAEYKARISKAMEKAEDEEEAEEKYMMRMLKDEYKDEYSKYRDMYGEDADKRFYDNYRYKTSGRFAPKGRGSYMPRRGYDEPPYYHMSPEMYREHEPEWYRDMDRMSGKMYFTEPIRMDSTEHMRDSREGRSGMSRRSYMEAKEMHSDNTPESKQAKMRELEKYMRSLSDDLTEAIDGASNEEKTMLKSKLATLAQKIV